MPRIPAFRRSAHSVRLIFFAISGSGVRVFECALSSRTSSFVHDEHARPLATRCAESPIVGHAYKSERDFLDYEFAGPR
jgi:hypothetical protein